MPWMPSIWHRRHPNLITKQKCVSTCKQFLSDFINFQRKRCLKDNLMSNSVDLRLNRPLD